MVSLKNCYVLYIADFLLFSVFLFIFKIVNCRFIVRQLFFPMNSLILILISNYSFVGLVAYAGGYSIGAPDAACQAMTPGHSRPSQVGAMQVVDISQK